MTPQERYIKESLPDRVAYIGLFVIILLILLSDNL
jgi:hypothetical protein